MWKVLIRILILGVLMSVAEARLLETLDFYTNREGVARRNLKGAPGRDVIVSVNFTRIQCSSINLYLFSATRETYVSIQCPSLGIFLVTVPEIQVLRSKDIPTQSCYQRCSEPTTLFFLINKRERTTSVISRPADYMKHTIVHFYDAFSSDIERIYASSFSSYTHWHIEIQVPGPQTLGKKGPTIRQ